MKTAIIILGMHRSGTSLLTRTINLLGAYAGKNSDMIPPQKDNPKGFWEHKEIVQFHDDLFDEFSSNCNSTRLLPEKWMDSPFINFYIDRAKRIILDSFSESTFWVCKDPRMCMFLPLWKKVFNDMNISPHFIITYRNPIDVAKSLNARNGLPIIRSLKLWYIYILNILYYLPKAPVSIVDYDGFLREPQKYIKKIEKEIKVTFNTSQLDEVEKNISLDLRHSNTNRNELQNIAPKQIVYLYDMMGQLEDNISLLFTEEFKTIVQDLLNQYRSHYELFECPDSESQDYFVMESFVSTNLIESDNPFDSVGIDKNSCKKEYVLNLPYVEEGFIILRPINFPAVVSIKNITLFSNEDPKKALYCWDKLNTNEIVLFKDVEELGLNNSEYNIMTTGNNSIIYLKHNVGYLKKTCFLKISISVNDSPELMSKLTQYKIENLRRAQDFYLDILDCKKEARQNLFIWGIGSGGERTYRFLTEYNFEVAGFVDTFKSKTTESFLGLKVYSPSEFFLKWNKSNAYVIIGSSFHEEISRKLIENNFDRHINFAVNSSL